MRVLLFSVTLGTSMVKGWNFAAHSQIKEFPNHRRHSFSQKPRARTDSIALFSSTAFETNSRDIEEKDVTESTEQIELDGPSMAVVYVEDEDGDDRASPNIATLGGLNSVAALNFAAISLFTLTALYQLLHVDVEAAVALFRFDDAMEASAFATSIDLFLRLPFDSLHGYEELVPTNPVFFKACTSGVAYTIGDFVSQVYQGRDLESFDLKRSARSGIAGFIGHGPLCHYWMTFMETYLDFDGAWWGTGVKVIADQTVWSIYLNAVYSFLIGVLAFRPVGEVWEDVKLTSWPALRTSWRFWPFVHAISFSHAVPLDLKLLWVDTMEIVWVTLLSKVANDDKEAAKAELDGEASSSASGEAPESSSLLAMAQSGWTAGWPLVAMWPFLFLSFQGEKFLGLESESGGTSVASVPPAVHSVATSSGDLVNAVTHHMDAAVHMASSTPFGHACETVASVCGAAAHGIIT